MTESKDSGLTRKEKVLRRAVPVAVAASLVAGGVIEASLHPIEKGVGAAEKFLGQSNEIKIHPFHKIDGTGDLQTKLYNQFLSDKITVQDLAITVPPESPSLKIRYYPRTFPSAAEGEYNGIAVEIPSGVMLDIKNAAVVEGDQVNPNDPLSNLWYAVNLNQFQGLEGYGYISASQFTRPAITATHSRSEVIKNVSLIDEGQRIGEAYFTNNQKQDVLVGKVTVT